MPQELEIVFEVATGKPAYMHSVDAAEACSLGDYSRMPPEGKEVSDEDKAKALAASRGMAGVTHPELQTPEQRAEARKAANAAATPVVQVPMGTPVVMAPASPVAATEPPAARGDDAHPTSGRVSGRNH
jgi:hypothetical protein